MEEKIINEGSIWDLHIHTCACPKESSEFSRLSVHDYIDKLMEIFEKYPKLRLISFTDHNKISKEVYDEFKGRKSNINFVVGIEVDINLNKNDKNYKHLIFYFDPEKFNFDEHAKAINDKLEKGVPEISEFLSFLTQKIRVPFLISPHAFKQDKRGIVYEWSSNEIVEEQAHLYMDQFFNFWEAGGYSEIEKTIAFLNEFLNGKKISVISFSDSNNFSKLQEYLNNPPQYFNSLPTFNGMRMAGSDVRRITKNCYCVSEDDRPSFIGKIVINGKNIEVSPKLNTIIGSRGSGKSLFLDKIYMSLHNENDNIGFFKNKDRMNFIASQQMELYDMNNNLLNTNFYVDYYDQGYISKVFENKDSLINTDYFGSEMSKIPDFNIEMEKGKLIEALSFVKSNANKSTENIVSLIQRIPILNDNTKNYKNFKIIKSSILEFIEYDDFLTKTRRIFPKSIIDEIEIDDLIEQFFYKVKERIHTKNIKKLLSDYFTYELESKYNNIINTLSQERKMKSQTLKSVKQYLISNTSKICDRVAFINNLLKLSIETKTIQNKNTSSKGFDNNEFIFEKKLEIENPLRYVFRIFNQYFDSRKCQKTDKTNFDNIESLIEMYCFHLDEVIMESRTEEDLDDELFNLKSIEIKQLENIYYKTNNKFIDVKKQSPGTKANILMEYIVHKDTKIPLLIDQPEDNIDNKTIYSTLTKWFAEMKSKRQVFVVTHDANLVVNGDAENVIICEQNDNLEFKYDYGALETNNSLYQVSNILEGGTDAIERRLIKYGKQSN